jgi:hypothetical protein
MRVLICGGREFSDVVGLFAELNKHPITAICHGDARGADTLAGSWAQSKNIPCRAFPADWDKYGKRAGPIRNAKMLNEFKPDYVLAFPGGNGTEDMVWQAERARIPVLRANP